MQAREWILTMAVIVVPLIIAVAVTLWSLDQVRYRPKKRRAAGGVARETSAGAARVETGTEGSRADREPAAVVAGGAAREGATGAGVGAER